MDRQVSGRPPRSPAVMDRQNSFDGQGSVSEKRVYVRRSQPVYPAAADRITPAHTLSMVTFSTEKRGLKEQLPYFWRFWGGVHSISTFCGSGA